MPSSSSDPMKSVSTTLSRTAQLSRHLSPASLSTMAETSQSAAPWRAPFLKHLSSMSEQSFTLSTLHPISTTSPQDSANFAPSVCPRARTVIYRGMWADMPVNPKNPAELNPKDFESDLLTLTSDARMEKVPEMLLSNGVPAGKELQSGRGGPVEAVFWMNDVKMQWRIRGHSYIIGPDIDSPAHSSVRDALQKHMRPTSQDSSSTRTENVAKAAPFSFSRELTAHFGNLSPGMRGTFKNPPPGTPLSQTPNKGEGLGQKVEGTDDEIARKNFRVVVVVAEEVDQVDLSDPAEGKRWNYKLVGGEEGGRVGTWKITEMWP